MSAPLFYRLKEGHYVNVEQILEVRPHTVEYLSVVFLEPLAKEEPSSFVLDADDTIRIISFLERWIEEQEIESDLLNDELYRG